MMGCPCQSSSPGMLSGLMGDVTGRPVHIEAPFSLGVELYSDAPWYSGQYGIDFEAIAAALNESDYVSGVSVFQIAGVLHPFIAVEGYSTQEYGRDQDLRNAILSVIDDVYGVQTNRGSVRSEVETYDPTTGETQTTRYDAPSGGGAGGAPQEPSGPSFLDQLALDLGIKKQSVTWLAIGGVALAVVLISRR